MRGGPSDGASTLFVGGAWVEPEVPDSAKTGAVLTKWFAYRQDYTILADALCRHYNYSAVISMADYE